ncbi:MAG: DUF3791 domain-containing protein [Clostridiales Family XIII bacterium]|jgi:hypothetical protein|nr:DUF3791 domain-containing protein [Clostridiales Family XIII bacterium]
MTANIYILHYKLNGIINEYAKQANVPVREAFDLFYRSNLYQEVRGGVSDMHCRSNGYLAEELLLEQERESARKA